MIQRAFIAVLLLAALAACSREPEANPPPIQRALGAYKAPALVLGPFLEKNDPNAPLYILSGVQDYPEGDGWRWTHERPEIRFALGRTEGWRFTIDLSLPADNMKATGPVTITFFVNGHSLETVRYSAPGDHHFEKPVPPDWLTKDRPNIVAADVKPPWVSPLDGAKLGFVLHRAGFVPR